MNGKAHVLCRRNSLRMDWPHIAIKDDIGDLMLSDEGCKGIGPVRWRPRERNKPAVPERKCAVACIKANPPYLCPRTAEHKPKPMEERPVWTL